MSQDLHWQDATEIARRIREREIAAIDVLDHFLTRVERINPMVNAIVATDIPGARNRAAAADAALARGELWGPLHGVPMTIKDTFEVVGMPCVAGHPQLRDYRPDRNATVPQRFLDAGAIIFGKTNVPEFVADLQTRNSIYGTTGSAWDPDNIAGGSSGGAASALAAGITTLEFGSDIGGSTRNPAHFNGVFGMRPTWGTISPVGHIPGPPGSLTMDDFGTPGPLARSARDLRLAFDIARGSEPRFGEVLKPELPSEDLPAIAELRVGLWLDDPIAPVDVSVGKVLAAAVAKLRQAGLVHVEDAQPDVDAREGYRLYSHMGAAIVTSGTPPEERERLRLALAEAERQGAADSPEFDRHRSVLLSFADYMKASDRRGYFRAKWADYFRIYNLMLSPIMSLSRLAHGENLFHRTIFINGEAHSGRDQLFWAAPQVLASLPSVVVPAGFTDDGLPCGLQITGGHLRDYQVIRAAELIGGILGAADQHPDLPGD